MKKALALILAFGMLILCISCSKPAEETGSSSEQTSPAATAAETNFTSEQASSAVPAADSGMPEEAAGAEVIYSGDFSYILLADGTAKIVSSNHRVRSFRE